MRIDSGRGQTNWGKAAALAGAMLLAVSWLAGCRGGDDTGAARFFEAGAKKYEAGKYDEAVADYERGLAVEPNSAVGYNLLGMAYRMKYNTLRASEWKEKEIEAFTRAVAADSTYWPARINLGATLYFLGEKERAAEQFRRALELHPDNPEREELERFIREGGMEPPR